MKKESKEMLKTIISYQELIMKALKIEIPQKKSEEKIVEKATPKKVASKKAPQKKITLKKVVKKTSSK